MEESSPETANIYESEKLVAEYLLFHYASAREILPYEEGPAFALNFAIRTVTETLDARVLPEKARALDVGCAVGRSAFELTRVCREVIALDYSQAFIDAARAIQDYGSLNYRRVDEGELTTTLTAGIPDGTHREHVSFRQGDAMDLPEDLGTFDIVHAANLLCRLSDPKKFLDRLPDLLNPGGQLIFTTPCTWMAEFTPKKNWLGGFSDPGSGRPVHTLDSLKKMLGANFEFQRAFDMPFLIREHQRKFQFTYAQASTWVRK